MNSTNAHAVSCGRILPKLHPITEWIPFSIDMHKKQAALYTRGQKLVMLGEDTKLVPLRIEV